MYLLDFCDAWQVEGSNGSQYLYTHEIGEYEPHYRQLQSILAFIE
jgi:hypothetical protein